MHCKDWCWSWSSNLLATLCKELTHLKRLWCWERLKAGEERNNKDEMIGWHHWLDGHEFEQALGVDNGQGSLEYWGPCGHKESDMTDQLNWTETAHKVRWILTYVYTWENITSIKIMNLSPSPNVSSWPMLIPLSFHFLFPQQHWSTLHYYKLVSTFYISVWMESYGIHFFFLFGSGFFHLP